MKTVSLLELTKRIGSDLIVDMLTRIPEFSLDLEKLSLDEWLNIYQKAKSSEQKQEVVKIIKEVFGVDIITSPIRGTFCAAGRRTSGIEEPLVKIGEPVKPDTVVCGVETMMVDNPVEAGVSGTIAKVCAKDGGAVEYDQPLFVVKLDS